MVKVTNHRGVVIEVRCGIVVMINGSEGRNKVW